MEWLIDALYDNRLGKKLGGWAFMSPRLHRWVETAADSPLSRLLARYLTQRYEIDLDEAELPLEEYRTLNEFFTRRLKPGARPFTQDRFAFVSPADAMLSVRTNLSISERLNVKGIDLDVGGLLDAPKRALEFDKGVMLVWRLYVPDCHRLYFPCDGTVGRIERVSGDYFSVTPRRNNSISHYEKNQRWITEFNSDEFGRMLFVDIGGFLISSVQFSACEGERVEQVQEKSIFRFGGSTLVALLGPGRIELTDRLLQASCSGEELRVKIADVLGTASREGS